MNQQVGQVTHLRVKHSDKKFSKAERDVGHVKEQSCNICQKQLNIFLEKKKKEM